MSLTFKPSRLRLSRKAGFLVRMRTKSGRAIISRRRAKKRSILSR